MNFKSLGKAKFQQRVKVLNTVGNAGNVGRVIRSAKDKQNDPKRQRKRKDWQNDN